MLYKTLLLAIVLSVFFSYVWFPVFCREY
jgi:hypothetical protein